MNSLEEWCRKNFIRFDEEQSSFERYLRSRGAKAFVDYGYENLEEKAKQLFEFECQRAIEQGLVN